MGVFGGSARRTVRNLRHELDPAVHLAIYAAHLGRFHRTCHCTLLGGPYCRSGQSCLQAESRRSQATFARRDARVHQRGAFATSLRMTRDSRSDRTEPTRDSDRSWALIPSPPATGGDHILVSAPTSYRRVGRSMYSKVHIRGTALYQFDCTVSVAPRSPDLNSQPTSGWATPSAETSEGLPCNEWRQAEIEAGAPRPGRRKRGRVNGVMGPQNPNSLASTGRRKGTRVQKNVAHALVHPITPRCTSDGLWECCWTLEL